MSESLPLLPLLRSEFGAKSELGLQANVKQFGLEVLHLCRRGLEGRLIDCRLLQERSQLLPSGHQILHVHPCRRALRIEQGANFDYLLILQPQALLHSMPEDLCHGGAILGREDGFSSRRGTRWP